MRLLLARKWSALAASGLLLAAVTLGVCRTTATCCPGALPREETSVSTSTQGPRVTSVARKPPQVHHADEANFHDLVLASDVPVLVDFYADWCVPCRRLGPILEELAAETPHARIVKVNVDQSPNLASQYDVSAIPNLKVFRNGAVVEQIAGVASKHELQSLLKR
jgi:thioredoxin 1